VDSPSETPIDAHAVRALQECIAADGVALFPADTVYGLACDPGSEAAIAKLYALKGRPARKPSALLFGSLQAARSELERLGSRTRSAAEALLPGALTLLLPNPERRFPLACDPAGKGTQAGEEAPAGEGAYGQSPVESVVGLPLGLRVPGWPAHLAALAAVEAPLMQSSANLAGEPPALALADVPPSIRQGADLVLDGGVLPGIASTVLDLTCFEREGAWRVVREGACSRESIARALASLRA
jgi:L-threonylcarbamoyladenylate synthase